MGIDHRCLHTYTIYTHTCVQEAFVNRVLTEHAQLKTQVTDSTEALIEAARADDEEDEEEDDERQSGCLQGVLRLKGVGFVQFAEVERALRKVCDR
jgi:hypothetical protein